MTRCPTFQTPTARGGQCDGCGDPLAKGFRRWCSHLCSDAYWNNHGWSSARVEASRRATGFTADGLTALIGKYGYTVRWDFMRCDQCGATARDVPGGFGLEVNHVEPRVGAGYGEGCWNHQTNLQVLCHPCHVAETTRQRHERMPERPPASPRSPSPPMDSLWDVA